MSGNKLFLDTNIILYLLNGDNTVADFIDGKQLFVSFISQLELLGYHGLKSEDREKIVRFLSDCTIVDINEGIKTRVINIRAEKNIKLPDAIIAATSVFYDLPLFSADKGLKKIDELNLIFYSE
jgi:predicted nucleic acid-binding protein